MVVWTACMVAGSHCCSKPRRQDVSLKRCHKSNGHTATHILQAARLSPDFRRICRATQWIFRQLRTIGDDGVLGELRSPRLFSPSALSLLAGCWTPTGRIAALESDVIRMDSPLRRADRPDPPSTISQCTDCEAPEVELLRVRLGGSTLTASCYCCRRHHWKDEVRSDVCVCGCDPVLSTVEHLSNRATVIVVMQ